MNNGKKLTRVTTYYTRGKSFEICKDNDGKYWGIPSEAVINGILQKQFNGITGHRSNTIQEVMDSIEGSLDMEELTASGINPFVASLMVGTKKTFEEVIAMCKQAGVPEEQYI